jgi:ribonuclease E
LQWLRGVESLALALLRLIGEEARKDRTVKVIAQLPVEVATYLMNEKREWLNNIEAKSNAEVILVPNKYFETPAYEIRRVRDDEAQLPENSATSHLIPVAPIIAVEESVVKEKPVTVAAPAVISSVIPTIPPPPSVVAEERAAPAAAPVIAEPQVGIFVRLWRFFFGGAGAPATPPESVPEPSRPPRDAHVRRERSDARPPRSRDRYGRDHRGGGDRDRSRARPDSKGKPAQPRDQQRRDAHAQPERKPREVGDTQRPPSPPAGPQAAAPQPAPRAEAPPARAESAEGQQRGERGERGGRNRRGRRRRGRGREEGGQGNSQGASQGAGGEAGGAQEGGGESRESRPEPRPTPQQSFDLPHPAHESRPSHESSAAPAAPKPDTAHAGGSDAKSFTVWSSGPSSSSSSWGGSQRDE